MHQKKFVVSILIIVSVFALQSFNVKKDKVRNFQPPVSGQEIMDIFGLPACATVGDIKMRIKDAILDGIIPNDYEAAKAYMYEVAKEMGIVAP